MKTKDYIPEIDGLRGLAVLLVLFFHLLPSSLPGGFIGVDIFFVISGFVITKKILRDIETDKFSIVNFYINRVHRLFPALLLVLFVSLFFAFHIFSLDEFRRFGASFLSATISLSNFKFWRESGYFDVGADQKPLLHTWSLSVEEQLYILWPILILVAYKYLRGRVFLIIALIGLVSICANSVFLDDSASIFFLTPFRVYEFCIGALCIPLTTKNKVPRYSLTLFSYLAIIAILFQSFFLGQTDTFPFYNALPACVSAGILIVGSQGSWVGKFLSSRSMLFLGRSSYSIYLVHWPLIVFYKYYVYRDLHLTEVSTLLLASLFFGFLLHFSVEKRFRINSKEQLKTIFLRKNIVRFGTIISLASVATLTGAIIRTSDGMPWRITTGLAFDFNENAAAYVEALVKRRKGVLRDCPNDCLLGNKEIEEIVLFVGDSHMDHYTLALSEMSDSLPYRFKLITSAGCFFGQSYTSDTGAFESDCLEKQDELIHWLSNPNVIGVMHGQRWPGYRNLIIQKNDNSHVRFENSDSFLEAITGDVKDLYEKTRPLPLLLVGDSPDAPDINCAIKNKSSSPNCKNLLQENNASKIKAISNASDDYAGLSDYYLPRQSLCDQECGLLDKHGDMMYIDSNHLSLSGARIVLPQLLTKFYHLAAQRENY